MIKAIVYHTKTGYTERYAKILSERTGLPCYNMNEALGQFGKNDEVIFMGNIMTGTVKGCRKRLIGISQPALWSASASATPPTKSKRTFGTEPILWTSRFIFCEAVLTTKKSANSKAFS